MKNQHKTRLKRLKRQRELRGGRGQKNRPRFRGKITVTAGGFGFVALPPGEEGEKNPDIFIPPRFLNSAMDGDEVEIELLPDRPDISTHHDRGPAGRIVTVINRAHDIIVGEVIAGHKARPLNKRIATDVKINGSLNGARRGDWVEVKLLHSNARNDTLSGSMAGKIGAAGTIEKDLDAICREFKLPTFYSDEENARAAAIKPRPVVRQPLESHYCVTIDPIDAKDYDDAISVAPGTNPEELVLGIHIADVAAWIAPESFWDKAAIERGFTAYLPGRTLPLLPKSLTAAISLTPNIEQPAHSVLIRVHRHTGKILGSQRLHSIIRIRNRLNFDEVQEYIDKGTVPSAWDTQLPVELNRMLTLFRTMRRYRSETEKFLHMSIPESRVLCDEEKNEIIGIVRKAQREADELVEEFMLAANTQVATEFIDKSLPGIFRVHPEPEPEKLEEFTALCLDVFGVSPGDLSSRTACNRFLENLPDGPRRPAILNAFLRSLPRASYVETPALHFGLGKTRYLHFTSPIRRYPDLLVHQQLWEHDTAGRLRSKKITADMARECSQKEENNDNAYYTANDRLKLRYLVEEMGRGRENMHEGIVAKITSSGMSVDIQDIGIYGFVPLDKLSNDFRRQGNRLVSHDGRKSYKCGDYVYLKLSMIDPIRGAAIFRPV